MRERQRQEKERGEEGREGGEKESPSSQTPTSVLRLKLGAKILT